MHGKSRFYFYCITLTIFGRSSWQYVWTSNTDVLIVEEDLVSRIKDFNCDSERLVFAKFASTKPPPKILNVNQFIIDRPLFICE
jgi:hypothetical protein